MLPGDTSAAGKRRRNDMAPKKKTATKKVAAKKPAAKKAARKTLRKSK